MNTEQNQNLNTAGTTDGVVTTNTQVVSNDIAGQPTPNTGVTPVVNQVTNPQPTGPDPAIAEYRRQAEAAQAQLDDPEVKAFIAQRAANAQAEQARQMGTSPEMLAQVQALRAQQDQMLQFETERQAQAGFQSFASTNGMDANIQREFIGYIEKALPVSMHSMALQPGFNFEPYMHGFAASKGLSVGQAQAPRAQAVLVPGHATGANGASTNNDLLKQRIQERIKRD